MLGQIFLATKIQAVGLLGRWGAPSLENASIPSILPSFPIHTCVDPPPSQAQFPFVPPFLLLNIHTCVNPAG